MIALTSLSPSHINFNNQQTAIDSWNNAGYKPVSLNCKEEIQLLQDFKNIEFVETTDVGTATFGKPYVEVLALLKFIENSTIQKFLILNSDLIISNFNKTNLIKELSDNAVVVLKRFDFNNETMNEGEIFESGFDGFFIDKKFIETLLKIKTKLCLGQCFWDYFIPYNCILNKIPMFRVDNYLFHKKHTAQYSMQQWAQTATIFFNEISQIDNSIPNDINQMGQLIHQRINQNLIHV